MTAKKHDVERRRVARAARELVHPAAEIEQPDVEASSDRYARRFAGSTGAWFIDVQARATLDLLRDLPPRQRILDVGGGHAQLAPVLLAAGHHVTVLGSTPACAARLARWTRDGQLRFDVGDIQRLPYPDASFDVALSFRTLAHLRTPARLIGELCRVAGRSVIADYPTARSLNVAAQQLFSLKLRVERDTTRRFSVLSPDEVRRAFAGHGFAVAGERPQYALPMALHRMLGVAAVSRALEAPPRLLGLTRRFGSPVIVRADRTAARA